MDRVHRNDAVLSGEFHQLRKHFVEAILAILDVIGVPVGFELKLFRGGPRGGNNPPPGKGFSGVRRRISPRCLAW